jgi:hypothetical protein
MTAQDYLISLRLAHAKLLLQHAEMSVGDVCFESGFRHLSHFAAMFQRSTGVTPAAWRQSRMQAEKRSTYAALGALAAIRTAPASAGRALPLYIRRGSALYLTHLALAHAGTGNSEVLELFRPFLLRPDRRNSAIRLIGAICEGTGEAGVAAIETVFHGIEEVRGQMPLVLGEAMRGRPFPEVASVLGAYLLHPDAAVTGAPSTDAAAVARRNEAVALGIALRDSGDERALSWAPYFFRTGDGLLDNAGVVTLGLIFRGTANARVLEMLNGCLVDGLARETHDHTMSPACLCNASEAMALLCRNTSMAPAAADAIRPLVKSRDADTVHDGVRALARLFTGQAPAGVDDLLPFVKEGHFSKLLCLFDGASPSRALSTIEALWSHPSPMMRRTVALALGIVNRGTGDEHARRLLEQSIHRASPKLRGDSLMALGLVEHGRGDRAVFELAKQNVRIAQQYLTRSALLSVGLALQGKGDEEAFDWAASFAGDSSRYVAAAAIQCLGLLGQGRRDNELANRVIQLSKGNRRLTNDADLALLMLDFDAGPLSLLSRWEGFWPRGEYSSTSYLATRFFSRGPLSRCDVDEPFLVL